MNSTKLNNLINKIIQILTISTILVSPFIFIKNLYNFASLSQSVFIQLISFLLIFLLSIKLLLNKNISINFQPISYILFAFITWSLISIIWSQNRYNAFTSSLYFISGFVFYNLILHYFNSKKWINRIFIILAFIGFFISLIGIFQHIFAFSWIPQIVKPAATFGNKNMASHVVSITLPFSFIFLIIKFKFKKVFNYIFLALLLSTSFLYLYFTVTRSSWLASFISITFITISLIFNKFKTNSKFKLKKKKTFIKFISVASLIIIILISGIFSYNNIKSISKKKITAITSSSSLHVRINMWKNGIQIIKDYPIFGIGNANFKTYYPKYAHSKINDLRFTEQKQPKNIHNDFLQKFIELGLIGLILFLLIFIIAILIYFKLIKRNKSSNQQLTSNIIMSSIMAIFIISMFSFPFECPIPVMLFFICLSVLSIIYNKKKLKTFDIPFKLRICISCIMIIYSILMINVNIKRLYSDYYYKLALRHAKSYRLGKTVKSAYSSIKSNPYNYSAHQLLGWAYTQSSIYSRGIKSYKTSLEVNPYDSHSLFGLSEIYFRIKDYNKAIAYTNKITDILPRSYKAYFNLAKYYYKNGNLNKALYSYLKSKINNKKNFKVYVNLGSLQFKLKNYIRAVKEYENALNFKPDYIQIHINLAIIYSKYMKNIEKFNYHKNKFLKLNKNKKAAFEFNEIYL